MPALQNKCHEGLTKQRPYRPCKIKAMATLQNKGIGFPKNEGHYGFSN
jgi:hypothetical protein